MMAPLAGTSSALVSIIITCHFLCSSMHCKELLSFTAFVLRVDVCDKIRCRESCVWSVVCSRYLLSHRVEFQEPVPDDKSAESGWATN